ncbi:reverse transcriptase [Caerostris darwini]|uniref:Reverse transcriptase n=1 Tax=Caerostris darwini TaxID=1538125 RepID=A0AAV4ML61_9ARAC|nr:reverse transcriptase [Caerostris darwini]
MGDQAIERYCDVVSNRIRTFVSEVDRKKVLSSLHSISDPGIKATVKLMEERNVWPGIKADARTWAQQCLACQRWKVTRHTQSKLGAFIPSNARFEHVHIDIADPCLLQKVFAIVLYVSTVFPSDQRPIHWWIYQQVPFHRLSILDGFPGSVLHFKLQQIRAPSSKPHYLKP